MSSQPPNPPPDSAEQIDVMLTPKEFAKVLKVSVSFLAKARKRGVGEPFIRVGRSIRYFPLRRPK